MTVFRIIVFALLIYALYRLVFHFIIPVVRVSGKMKKKMQEFQDQMNQQYKAPEEPLSNTRDTKQKTGDYIDFEEVKWAN